MGKYIALVLLNVQLFHHIAQSASDYTRYDNYYVYRISIENEKHLEVVKDLQHYSDGYIVVATSPTSCDVIVPPHKYGDFHRILIEHAFDFEILSENLQTSLDEENMRMNKVGSKFNWDDYHTLDVIYKWMAKLASVRSDNVKLITVGKSFEKRKIQGIKLTYNSLKSEFEKIFFNKKKKHVIMVAGMHGREWIAPAVLMYILNWLIISKNPEIRKIVRRYDWYVIPVMNPDGYVYSHTTNRFWCKTRKPYTSTCFGADPNRNWDHHWGERGNSSNPCSDIFMGDKPFSEIETTTVSKYLKSLAGQSQIEAYIAFHGYSQNLLFPYGYANKTAPNYAALNRVANRAIRALAGRYKTSYQTGSFYDMMYAASGSSMEWIYDKLKVKYAFTYGLRPDTRSSAMGFLLNPNQIIPTGQETLDSVVALFKEINRL